MKRTATESVTTMLGSLLVCLTLAGSRGACGGERAVAPQPSIPLRSSRSISEGRALFLRYCAVCHRARGEGERAMQQGGVTPDFRKGRWQRSRTDEYLFSVISRGKPGTAMPAWPMLTDEDRWKLIAYIRSLRE